MTVLSTYLPPEPELQANIRRFEAGRRLLAAPVVKVVESDRSSSLNIIEQSSIIAENGTCLYLER